MREKAVKKSLWNNLRRLGRNIKLFFILFNRYETKEFILTTAG